MCVCVCVCVSCDTAPYCRENGGVQFEMINLNSRANWYEDNNLGEYATLSTFMIPSPLSYCWLTFMVYVIPVYVNILLALHSSFHNFLSNPSRSPSFADIPIELLNTATLHSNPYASTFPTRALSVQFKLQLSRLHQDAQKCHRKGLLQVESYCTVHVFNR